MSNEIYHIIHRSSVPSDPDIERNCALMLGYIILELQKSKRLSLSPLPLDDTGAVGKIHIRF